MRSVVIEMDSLGVTPVSRYLGQQPSFRDETYDLGVLLQIHPSISTALHTDSEAESKFFGL